MNCTVGSVLSVRVRSWISLLRVVVVGCEFKRVLVVGGVGAAHWTI